MNYDHIYPRMGGPFAGSTAAAEDERASGSPETGTLPARVWLGVLIALVLIRVAYEYAG